MSEIRKEMGKIAEKRRRFGYCPIGTQLEREGITLDRKPLKRLPREKSAPLRHRCGRKRACSSRSPMPEAPRPNQRWSLEVVADSFGASRRFRIVAVTDGCCRQNLALIADPSISLARITRTVYALVRLSGRPESIVTDIGPAFASTAALTCTTDNGIACHSIDSFAGKEGHQTVF